MMVQPAFRAVCFVHHDGQPFLPVEHCNNLRGRRSVCDDLVRFIALFYGPGLYAGMSSRRTPSPR
jgi:hypothetical protein